MCLLALNQTIKPNHQSLRQNLPKIASRMLIPNQKSVSNQRTNKTGHENYKSPTTAYMK